MSKLILPGGTDVAETALFSIDALPIECCPNNSEIAAMEKQHSILRFGTGGDGGYLLHAYIDEPIPAEVMKYCVNDDAIHGKILVEHGQIGFGGVESLYRNYKPNQNIRSDGNIPVGSYEVTAYHTDFPDELIEDATQAKIGKNSQKLLNLPGCVIPSGIFLAIVAAAASAWIITISIIALVFIFMKIFTRHPRIKQLHDESRQVQLNYPSIVVEMKLSPTASTTS
jgi:hypothetical protein